MARLALSFQSALQTLTVVLVAGLAFSAAALHAAEPLPEVDGDGLHLVKGSKVAVAYVKPGVDFSKFDKVMLLDCFVEFREKWAKEYNLDTVGLQGRVSSRDEERIKKNLAAEFRTVFTDVLTEKGHPVVSEPGPGVLLLRPAIVNLDVAAPEMMSAGRGNTWIRSAGQMTLYMEMYDGQTEVLLARVMDPRADPNTFAKVASSVTNKAAVDKIVRHWAELLSNQLTKVKAGG